MPRQRSGVELATCITTAVGLGIIIFFFAHLGGLLNRSRGGYVNFRNPNNHSLDLDYWPAEIAKNLLFAVPTAVVVLISGLHVRASTVVFLMTFFSLYIGWGTYMNIGSVPTNYESRSGAFDWLVGRQEKGWSYNHRFLREFTGMSLRGLAWTAPQGYALQILGFGWEYALSGSLMGFVYLLGSRTPMIRNNEQFQSTFDAHTAYAEYYWGWWIWFVLVISCLSQIVRRMHIWIHSKNVYLGFNPFSMWEKMKYESLNRSLTRGMYEIFMVFFNIILMCSLVYYSLVQQKDLENKGMTFFGLLTGSLLLTFLQGWNFQLLYLRKMISKTRKTLPSISISTQSRHRSVSYASPRSSPRMIPDLDNLETAAAVVGGENKPLLGWHSRSSPQGHRTPLINAHEDSDAYRPHLQAGTIEPATTTTAILILWPKLEVWVWMDAFIWIRRFIGLVSLIATITTIIVSLSALAWDWNTQRYLHPNCTYTYGDV